MAVVLLTGARVLTGGLRLCEVVVAGRRLTPVLLVVGLRGVPRSAPDPRSTAAENVVLLAVLVPAVAARRLIATASLRTTLHIYSIHYE